MFYYCEKCADIKNAAAKAGQEVICEVCGSRSVQKISAVGKYAKIGVLGILGADDLGKTWKCTVCGSKF